MPAAQKKNKAIVGKLRARMWWLISKGPEGRMPTNVRAGEKERGGAKVARL